MSERVSIVTFGQVLGHMMSYVSTHSTRVPPSSAKKPPFVAVERQSQEGVGQE